MKGQARITVPLSVAEFDALLQSAQSDYRHPRDQARHILRSVLLCDKASPPQKENGSTKVDAHAAVPATVA